MIGGKAPEATVGRPTVEDIEGVAREDGMARRGMGGLL